ncbi:hypothetical protein SAMN02910456_02256 [Ruminococcaceae bacterium YRB3002]|nr:hypothetical protein SAMN02910456_02256 [Ruminococcaceae bacterium YRB3002]
MNTITKKILAAGLSVALVAGAFAACKAKEETGASIINTTQATDGILGGMENLNGWTRAESTELSSEDRALFSKAMDKIVGAAHAPSALLGTQLVSGTNYCFLCRSTAVTPDAKPYYTLVYIYADLNGNATAKNIVALPMPKTTAGDWDFVEPGSLYAPGIIDMPTSNMVGATYEAVDVLGMKETNDGTLYAVLCYITPVTPDAVPTLNIVVIDAMNNGENVLVDDLSVDIGALATPG